MTNQKKLLIRADASAEIGTGHVMRCIALAEAWQDTIGEVFFVSSFNTQALEDRLKIKGIRIRHINNQAGTCSDAEETSQIAHQCGADWIVVDGYHFGAEYQKTIKDTGLSLLIIDDYGHADHYYADIVLNQNIYADRSLFKKHEPFTRFLLGTKFVLLRKEFLKWSGWRRDIPEKARKILVTLGGGDPDNVTLNVINAIRGIELNELEVKVVVGSANPHFNLIHETINEKPGITLIKNTDNMPEFMAWADIAISAGGTTCYELFFMRVPSIIIPIAENQKPVANELKTKNITKVVEVNDVKNQIKFNGLIFEFLNNYKTRSEFSERMAQYIDGKGISRVINAISCNKITLRNVKLSDCKQIWLWINDPVVRSVSFKTNPISLQDHKEWFFSAVNNPKLVYYIAEDENATPIGQARFQIEAKEAIISVLVDPEYRGMSLGTSLILDATEKFFSETGIEKVNALIKKGNDESWKAFIKAGYVELGLNNHTIEPLYHLIKHRVIK